MITKYCVYYVKRLQVNQRRKKHEFPGTCMDTVQGPV